MSIQNELERIQFNVKSAYTAIQEKGGTLPTRQNTDNLANAIQGIPSGSGETTAYLVKSPVGTIVIWSGTTENIPYGWHLCDGEDGTPDLRDRFVLGAGMTHSVGESGGDEEVKLTPSHMPQHYHGISMRYGSSATIANNAPSYVLGGSGGSMNANADPIGSAGGSQPHNNMPPYYALCYIMKIEPDETDDSPGSTVNWEDIDGRPDLSEVSTRKTMEISLFQLLWNDENRLTVAVPGISADFYKQVITVVPVKESRQAYQDAGIICEDQAENSLIFHAREIPETDIVLAVAIEESVETKKIIGTFEWWSPEMTSNNAPEPYVASGSEADSSSRVWYKAFDTDQATRFESANQTEGQYLQFDFGKNTTISGISIKGPSTSPADGYTPKKFSLEGSKDGKTWTTIYIADGTKYPNIPSSTTVCTYEFSPKTYRYYKLTMQDNYSSNTGYMAISEMKFYKLVEVE